MAKYLVPRFRMVAGPNGSGKTTLVNDLKEKVRFGIYLNADNIEQELNSNGLLEIDGINIRPTKKSFNKFIQDSSFGNLIDPKALTGISIEKNKILSTKDKVDSYMASLLTQYLRSLFLRLGQTFSFETVMSHQSKLDFLIKTRKKGFRNYLYFISTESPLINIERVKLRVRKGGHDVDDQKIEERYYRSLEFLLEAIKLTDRAYLFDNSSDRYRLIAEVTNGTNILIEDAESTPNWFIEYVTSRLS